MAPSPPMPLPFGRGPRDRRSLTFLVDGQAFEIQRPFLAIHSPDWAVRLAENPKLDTVELDGDADSFRAFARFLTGADGDAGEVTPGNVLSLLHWGRELGVDHVAGQCEAFLLTGPRSGMEPAELLEVASRYDLAHLYTRATEAVAQGAHYVKVPEEGATDPVPEVFKSVSIREEVVHTHLSMGNLVRDGMQQGRHRFADHTMLGEPHQRARLLWKSQRRIQPPPEEPKDHDWRGTEEVLAHSSMYGEEWTVVAKETQPTHRWMSHEASARSAAVNAKTGFGGSRTQLPRATAGLQAHPTRLAVEAPA